MNMARYQLFGCEIEVALDGSRAVAVAPGGQSRRFDASEGQPTPQVQAHQFAKAVKQGTITQPSEDDE